MKHIYGRARIYTGDLFILHDKKQESWFISHAVAFISNFSTKTTTMEIINLKDENNNNQPRQKQGQPPNLMNQRDNLWEAILL